MIRNVSWVAFEIVPLKTSTLTRTCLMTERHSLILINTPARVIIPVLLIICLTLELPALELGLCMRIMVSTDL